MVAAVDVLAYASFALAEDGQKTVLVLYTTRRDAQIVSIGEREMPRILESGLGAPIDYYPEYIDPSRFPDPVYRSALRDFLALKYRSLRFNLVIAMQDAAVQFVADHRDSLFGGAPVVFCSNSSDVGRIPNSTGLVFPLDFSPTIELITRLQPEVRRVYVVTGASERDRAFARTARTQFRTFEPHLAFTTLDGLPTADLDARLASLESDAAVFYLIVNQDGAGRHFHPLQYLSHVASVSSVPTYSWVDSAMDRGILGGSLRNQQQQIEAMGRLALRVLKGEPPDAIPLASLDVAVDEVDWRQLRRWGISESRVPSSAIMRFREPSAWERYRTVIVATLAVLLAQSALIAALIIHRARRRQAEVHLRTSEAALRESYGRIRDLGTRLLTEQEAERSRIARELHDDIGQQLTLLTLDLRLIATDDGAGDGLAGAALARAQVIASSVHNLSHRLHPAKLRLVGLPAAIQSLPRELSQADIAIRVGHENVPSDLPTDLTLPLFRIVQEALQNAIKYSRAHEVSVDLIGEPGGLALIVTDDGVGFDVEAMWGKGLGLVSMRERLDAIGGTLLIQSRIGAGTRIEARVPASAWAAAVTSS